MNEGMFGMFSRPGGGSVIKSIQHCSLSISAGLTGTTAINKVDVNKSIIVPAGTSSDANSFQQCSVRLEFTSEILVTGRVNMPPTPQTTTINFAVVEFF